MARMRYNITVCDLCGKEERSHSPQMNPVDQNIKVSWNLATNDGAFIIGPHDACRSCRDVITNAAYEAYFELTKSGEQVDGS